MITVPLVVQFRTNIFTDLSAILGYTSPFFAQIWCYTPVCNISYFEYKNIVLKHNCFPTHKDTKNKKKWSKCYHLTL
jgi:hypothetical protein